jgi:hypothetical protein
MTFFQMYGRTSSSKLALQPPAWKHASSALPAASAFGLLCTAPKCIWMPFSGLLTHTPGPASSVPIRPLP